MKHPNLSLTTDGGYRPYRNGLSDIPAIVDLTFDESRPDDFELLIEDDLISP